MHSGLRSAVALRLESGEPDHRKIGERGTDGKLATLAGYEALPRLPVAGCRLRVRGAGRLAIAAVRLCRRLQRGTDHKSVPSCWTDDEPVGWTYKPGFSGLGRIHISAYCVYCLVD